MAEHGLLAREFEVFARYLGASGDLTRGMACYAAAHQTLPVDGDDRFERWLVRAARTTPIACGFADAYARRMRPYGRLRRKLVLTLAVLESSPDTHAAFDTALASSTAMAWLSLAALGAGWIIRTALAFVLLAPMQLAAAIMPATPADG